ncbi:hypothetical protein ABID56_002349 [Alkalibacillus flavidus]|uniref:O-antigen ligase like membrane protein n=1 Tax=Alkalibacillus flavidus TaxID=546021 RepID=A0ABV2KXC1_9BACI
MKLDHESLIKYLWIFILIQPVIDLMTSLMVQFTDTVVTVGALVRVLFVALFFVVIVYISWTMPKHRKILYYVGALALVLIASLVVTILFKDPYSLVAELQFLFKIVYFNLALIALYLMFKEIVTDKQQLLNIVFKAFFFVAVAVGASILIAVLTQTSLESYSHTKVGYKGWFFSGNEISAVLAITYPMAAYYIVSQPSGRAKGWMIVALTISAIGFGLMGTKVALGGILLTTLTVGYHIIVNRFGNGVKGWQKFNTTLFIALIVVVTAHASSSFLENIANQIYQYENVVSQPTEEEQEQIDPDAYIKDNFHASSRFLNLILSSRDIYVKIHHSYFVDAPVAQKLFGMGYASNYSEDPKTVEIDAFDLFYSIGIIGFIVYVIPIVYMLYRIIRAFFDKGIKATFKDSTSIFILVSLAIACGISTLAGHVITAPAVSIYLALVMCLTLITLQRQ